MGHDSERAAIIYQHEARGADLAITSAIDAHIETAKASQGQPSDGPPEAQPKTANGPLMARRDQQDASRTESRVRPLTWCFVVERVTGIEPALSAWESNRSGPLTWLTWALGIPWVTVMSPSTPGLMARQWPEVRSRRGRIRAPYYCCSPMGVRRVPPLTASAVTGIVCPVAGRNVVM